MCYNFRMSSGTVIERDVYCLDCGYNLRAIGMDGDCPECGLRIGTSLESIMSGIPADVNKRIVWGLGLLILRQVSPFLLVYINQLFSHMQSMLRFLPGLVIDIASIVCMTTAAFLLTHTDVFKLLRLDNRLRLTIRIAAVLSALFAIGRLTSMGFAIGGVFISRTPQGMYFMLTTQLLSMTFRIIFLAGLLYVFVVTAKYIQEWKLARVLKILLILLVSHAVVTISYDLLTYIIYALSQGTTRPVATNISLSFNRITFLVPRLSKNALVLWTLITLLLFFYRWRAVGAGQSSGIATPGVSGADSDSGVPRRGNGSLLAGRAYQSVRLLKWAMFFGVLLITFLSANYRSFTQEVGDYVEFALFGTAGILGIWGVMLLTHYLLKWPRDGERLMVSPWISIVTVTTASIIWGIDATLLSLRPYAFIFVPFLYYVAGLCVLINLRFLASSFGLESIDLQIKRFICFGFTAAALMNVTPNLYLMPLDALYLKIQPWQLPVSFLAGLWLLVVLNRFGYELARMKDKS